MIERRRTAENWMEGELSMKGLDTGKDKVKKICDILKRETLEPAEQEAEALIQNAKRVAEEMLASAKHKAAQMLRETQEEIGRQKAVFEASLTQACRQAIEILKEKIEEKIFAPELAQLLHKPLQEPGLVARMLSAVVEGLEREGTKADLNAYISSAVPVEKVSALLGEAVLARLKEKEILLAPIGGGVQVRLKQEHITIDLSDAAVQELVSNYIRKDFRRFIFG